MARYVIEGGKRLEGESCIDGAKNAVLPIIAATILSGKESVIHNCPNISDVKTMIEILRHIGCTVIWNNKTLIINSLDINRYEVPDRLVRKMRSSIVVLGALLGRFKQGQVSYPGGCPLGARPIDLHLKAFKDMGAYIIEDESFIICKERVLHGAKIHLDFPSVGATENIMLASVLAKGTTIIHNAAKEPEIKDLQDFLNAMGAKVEGGGNDTIVIEGVDSLNRVEFTVMPDRIIAGTYLIAGAMTKGEISLINVNCEHLIAITSKLREVGCQIVEEKDKIHLTAPNVLNSIDLIKTQPYPGFPTDMQAQFMALLSIAKGTSVILETVFESRYKHAEELVRLGADIQLERKIAIIKGVAGLQGATVKANDLRGGAALVLAGLMADGITEVENIEHIKRGYGNLVRDMQLLGAKIYTKE
ncbi:MAG TPA: UDP-N-acetylglucosamine 1-carboxyvinyltransferase [Epulopiscium sp.]|nr:UDP-N-acetylglucosamine 1-carboxyvinyltransferase [Candidatus Epulonipiscium sp.]